MEILKFSERIKIILVSVFIVMLGLFAMNKGLDLTLNQINDKYIKQNIALVGQLSKVEGINIEDVISSITMGDKVGYEKGKEILAQYSYDENLSCLFNPIFEANKNVNILFVFLFGFIMLILFTYMFTKIHVLISCLERLKKKAELILEGRDVEELEENFVASSVEELEVQFMIMKSRMDASVERLKIEKLNLKNTISDISHQLKTPLAAMGVYNQILVGHNEMEDSEINNFIELSNGQVRRIDFLVKSLLKYARLDNDVVKYKKIKQSINNTVKEAVHSLKVKADEKNIKVTIIEEEDINLIHDRAWVSEAIMNIIKNGIEHTDKNGKIDLRIIKSEIFTRIEIKDNGKGIDEKDISKIFERFHKGCNNINPESIGIGLSLSKKIIEANDGDISVRSKLGEGTKFIITFFK
ncbi:MAG: sensor histidine kinase [Sarcina sp.]